ncbi:hypothetical protein [Hylemonella gracilis]|uniref:hypothetical protein n=1 Tax=Hylemonella gracilis TaxID=80880 RepID=UPI00103ED0A9|nr:hypothetical protein [Hylemonella gracilis]
MTRILRDFCISVLAMVSCTSCFQQNANIDKVTIEEIDYFQRSVPGFIDFVTIRVAVIPGSIFGPPGREEYLVERAEMGSAVPLDMRRLLQMGASNASTAEKNSALMVQPQDMRFVRLGTLAVRPYTDDALGSGSFMDKKSRDYLVLLYADRPGLISGNLCADSTKVNIHVSIDRAGLHWIKIKNVTPTLYEFENANPSELAFGVPTEPVISLGLVEDLLCFSCYSFAPMVLRPHECTSPSSDGEKN